MATVTGMTAAAMLAIANTVVTGGSVDGAGHLILSLRGGGTIDAGLVKGPQGDPGVDAPSNLYWTGTSASAASIPNGAFTTVTGWGTSESNNTPYSALTGGVFTMNKAGFYQFSATVTWDQVSGGRRILTLYKNGAEQRRIDISSATSYAVIGMNHAMGVVVGDTVEFKVYQNSGAALALQASPGHRCDMIRIAA